MAPCQYNTLGLNGKELALNWSDLRVLACSFAATAAIIELFQKSDSIFTTYAHTHTDVPLEMCSCFLLFHGSETAEHKCQIKHSTG